MELSIKLVTRSSQGSRTTVLVLVLVIIAVLVPERAGCGPATAVTLALGAGLAGLTSAASPSAGSADAS
jgi:hypothetical protein